MKQIFTDRFIVPAYAKHEFIERMNSNRKFIKMLPGFIKDTTYECKNEQGHFILMAIAEWESEAALQEAKIAVQLKYQQEGFNPAAFMERLCVKVEREIFTEIDST